MKHGLLVLSSLVLSTAVAQDCGTGRYVEANLFSNVTTTSAVDFGSNTGVNGGTQTLRMDVYEPAGDVLTERPVVIVAFGGSFVGGARADVADLCIDFAKRGYVAVAPDYRVGFFFPNASTTTLAVMRGAHDLRACVRYLRKSVAEMDNPYHIDQDHIFIGGVSAGAISAVHAAYLDQDAEIPAVIAGQMAALGGLEGNSGNPGYDSDVFGVYSFSGAIGDTSWIAAGDQPIVSIHEVGDGVVPYLTQPVYVLGLPSGLTASGSHDIHERATHLGLTNCFKSYPGTQHVGYLSYAPAESMYFVSRFMGELICGQSVTCGELITSIAEAESVNDAPYPNPTTGIIRINLQAGSRIDLWDLNGRLYRSERISGAKTTLDLSELPNGAYTLRVMGVTLQRHTIIKAD